MEPERRAASTQRDAVASPLERRARRVLPVVAVVSFLLALSIHGWLGPRLEYTTALLLAGLSGAIAFAFLADRSHDRIFDAVAGAVVAPFCTYAIGFYLNDHTTAFHALVIVALVVGSIPGALLFFVQRRLSRHPVARTVVVVAALTATILVLGLRNMRVEADGSLRRARRLESMR